MPAANELELPTPLDGEEIKISIAHKIAEAVMTSLDKHCALYGKAYPKFQANFTIEYTLDNFGATREGKVRGEVPAQERDEDRGEYVPSKKQIIGSIPVTVTGEIPFTPPNLLRRETGQAVPTQVISERGMQETKAVIYKPKSGRGPKISRSVVR